MDFEWVAIALGDVLWISIAFVLGFGARQIGLPPLVGFLAAGFSLNVLGAVSGEMLQKLADLGITLLLFTIGLKLDLKTLMRPQVWAVTALHLTLTLVLFGVVIFGLSVAGLSLFSGLSLDHSLLIAFALSFSSTVFVVKVLEEKGEMETLHGNVAIGVLVMQDLAAVVFLTASSGKLPSPWAFLLLVLIPLRPLLGRLLERTGHGELLILYGLFLAVGGAELFELVGMKADLGALVIGALLAAHTKAPELAKTMLGFKDLFLVGFFLSIGLAGHPTVQTLLIAGFLVLLVGLKSMLFYLLLTRFQLRARTSLLTTLHLSNYSEFGLIVGSICVYEGWLAAEWLVVIAIALSLSFALAAPLNAASDRIYSDYRDFWKRWQTPVRLPDDVILDSGDATVAVFGMGRVGTGAYDKLREFYGNTVLGVDASTGVVQAHQAAGRKVLLGDPADADFWDRLSQEHKIQLVMLTIPSLPANLYIIRQLRERGFEGTIAATAKYPDEVESLELAGADVVFNFYAGAGAGFAEHVALAYRG